MFVGVTGLHAADWPQWQGRDRTRISKETGLLKEWPSGGPRVIWMASNLGTLVGPVYTFQIRISVPNLSRRPIGPLSIYGLSGEKQTNSLT